MDMPYRPISSWKRLARARVLVAAVAMGVAVVGAGNGLGAAAADASAPPTFLQQALPGATLLGQGQMRFLGLRIYDARLWAGPRFQVADFGAHALALELNYHRAFTGAAIAQRSIDEIERQGELTPGQAERWQQALAAVLPDVQPGECLTGLYEPGQGMRLWRDQQPLGAIDDAELAHRFFGIWLSPRTSEPGLRSALLGRRPGAGP